MIHSIIRRLLTTQYSMPCPEDTMEATAFKKLIVWWGSQTHKQIIVLRGQPHSDAFDSQSIALGPRHYKTKLDM